VDYEQLSLQLIQRAAGVRQKDLKSHFSDLDDCLFRAFECRVDRILSHAREPQALESSWEGRSYLSIASLSLQIERDRLLHQLCLLALQAAGAGMLSCFENVRQGIADLLYSCAPQPRGPSSKIAADASAGAILGLILRQLGGEYGEGFPPSAATLAFLALAPDVGASAAISAINQAQVGGPKGSWKTSDRNT
jgi:AcrR family transcriptional regulator